MNGGLFHLIRRLPLENRRRLLRVMEGAGIDRLLARRGKVVYAYAGRRIGVDLADFVGREMYKNGWYESAYVAFIQRHLTDRSGVFLDVGANVGNYSLALASCFGHTLAFEPNPATFGMLKANCERNPELALTPIQRGLSSAAKTLDFYPNDGANSGAAGFDTRRPAVAPLALKVEPGDSYTRAGNRVAAIKIDVEGHELQVLRGLHATLHRDRPTVFLEWLTGRMAPAGGVEALRAALPENYRLLASSNRRQLHLQPLQPPYRRKYDLVFCIPTETRTLPS